MPKMKTRRGAVKRFKVTAAGKIKRHRAHARHLMSSKTRKQRRHLKRPAIVEAANAKAIKRLIPYL